MRKVFQCKTDGYNLAQTLLVVFKQVGEVAASCGFRNSELNCALGLFITYPIKINIILIYKELKASIPNLGVFKP